MARPRLILPTYVSQGMIIQQNQPFVLHGTAEPSAAVGLALSRVPADGRPVSPLDPEYGVIFDASAVADENGAFTFELPALSASFDPLTLVLTSGSSRIEVGDILAGEVWVALGADNMAFPVRAAANSQHLLEQANTPYVRFLCPHPLIPDSPPPEPSADFTGGRWHNGDEPEAMADRSATAFAFARELCQEIHVPVGIIDLAMRNVRLYALLPRPRISESPALRDWLTAEGLYRDETNWNLQGEFNLNQPGAVFNSRLAPLAGLAVRGVLWQHGETDFRQPAVYAEGMKAFVVELNSLFRPASPRLNLIIAQLPPFYTGLAKGRALARFNEMLAAARQDWPCTSALVAVYDLPPDYAAAPEPYNRPQTPWTRQPVGHRMKLIACGLVYQRKAPSSAPECSEIERVGNKFMLSFSQSGAGLRLTGDDSRLRGFSVCGSDRVFLEASARLLYGLRVLVWHDQIPHPVAVSYADTDLNVSANLVSRDGLAVVPFRSDREPSRLSETLDWTHCEQMAIWAVQGSSPDEGPRLLPLFQPGRGRVDLSVERNNKSEGDGSLLVRYETDAQKQASFRPVLDYASMYPPLDVSPFETLAVDLFNPDQQFKTLSIEVTLAVPAAVATPAASAAPAVTPAVDAAPGAAKAASKPEEAGRLAETADPSESMALEWVPLPPLVLGTVTIEPALRWQNLRFSFSRLPDDRRLIRGLAFVIGDRKGKGQLYIDNIRLLLP